MQSIPPSLQAHLDSGFTTLANCILITREDGAQFAFTDLDRDVTFEGVTYKSKGGFSASALEASAGLAVDNMELEALIDDDSITEDDLKRGLFNGAAIEIFIINYEDLTAGSKIVLRVGTLGDIGIQDKGVFSTEIRGLTAKLQNRIGRVYAPTCNVRQLGDTRCKVSLTPFMHTATVTAITSNRVFSHTANVQDADYFNFGLLTWNAGSANAGITIEVKDYSVSGAVGTFDLQLPMKKNIEIGDSFTAVRGCDRRFATCRDVFDNVDNFRGFPDLPGIDQMLKIGGSG